MKKALFIILGLILALPQAGLAINVPQDCPNSNSYAAPVVSHQMQDNGLLLSWDKINNSYLKGYKVVVSKNDSSPKYPDNGYLKWITDVNVTSYLADNSTAYRNGDFGSYLENGEDYYFSVTAVYDCGGQRHTIAGNTIELAYTHGSHNDDDDDTDNDEYEDDTSNIALPVPTVSASATNAGVMVSWNKIDDKRFNGYKVVVSKNNSKPRYPEDGYIKYITDENTTSYLIDNSTAYRNGDFGNYLKSNENYYFSITALYTTGKVAGNSVQINYNGSNQETSVKPIKSSDPIQAMERNAELLLGDSLGDILSELQELRSVIKEQQNEIKYLRDLVSDLSSLTQEVRESVNQFITYGVDENTKKLGEGERAAVIYSYKSAFNKLPETENELTDAIKIANGRWPSQSNAQAENRAQAEFRKIYLRDPNMNNPNDNAAVTIMAYGLRQRAENRNLKSEEQGIATFRYIYNKLPETTEDWNIMQAITYSGAAR